MHSSCCPCSLKAVFQNKTLPIESLYFSHSVFWTTRLTGKFLFYKEKENEQTSPIRQISKDGEEKWEIATFSVLVIGAGVWTTSGKKRPFTQHFPKGALGWASSRFHQTLFNKWIFARLRHWRLPPIEGRCVCTATFHEPWEPWRQQLALKKTVFPLFFVLTPLLQNANGTLKFVATTKVDKQKTRKVSPLSSFPFKMSLAGTMVTIFLQ